jgi:hypothetical protein
MPIPNTSATHANTRVRSTRSLAMNTNPARTPRCSCSSCSVRSSANRPRTVSTIAAETTKENEFAANTNSGPMAASSAPPSAGPSMMPAFPPSCSKPFAQASSSSPTRFGTAAAEADQNGVSTTAATNPTAISSQGSCTNAIAA